MENLLFGSQSINCKKKKKSMKEFVTKDGRRVKEGDKLVKAITTLLGVIPVSIITLDEKSIPELVKEGVLTEVPSVTLSIPYCVEHLAKRIKWNVQNLDKYLDNLYEIYPAAVFSIVLRELAIIMDEKYPDHISNSEQVWAIRMTDGKIVQITSPIKSFNNFAAFRTLEDAIEAKKIMKEALADLFKRGGKQED